MRIVAGRFKGRTLDAPKGLGTRPTADRVREAVFNVLEHGTTAMSFEGARVLDLFAGSGALGLEALSRGARYALFIEDDAGARAAIRRNIEALGLTGATKIWRRDAAGLGPAGNMTAFNLVFCDPPYSRGLGTKALARASAGGWLAPGATAVLEEAAETEIDWPSSFTVLDNRRYGDTQVTIAAFTG